MCLIGLKLGSQQLLIAANRDEFHDRPAQPAHWWPDRALYAGRDERAGGTWLGVTAAGRFATVTNVREMQRSAGSRSRGDLALAFLQSAETAADFCQALAANGDDYGGFNLLAYDGQALWWCSNRSDRALQVTPGVHALSNHRLDSPWPKVQWLTRQLAGLSDDAPLDDIVHLLRNADTPPGELPDTGVGEALEQVLAPAFIIGQTYGTRCSTALRIHPAGFEMLELSYDPDGQVVARRNESSHSS